MPPGSTLRSQAAVCLLYLLFPGVLSRTNEAKRSFAGSMLYLRSKGDVQMVNLMTGEEKIVG